MPVCCASSRLRSAVMGLLMRPEFSESLADAQAIRYPQSPIESSDTFGMETNAERRRRKLVILSTQKGGLANIAARADLNPDTLEQVVKGTLLPPKKGSGERSPRSLGDSAARAIEAALDLERGWFDNDCETVDMTGPELLLLGYFRMLDEPLQRLVIEQVREAAERRAAIAESLATALKTQNLTPPLKS